jgi:hypothetical protein
MKNGLKMEFEKEKKKKPVPATLSAQAAQAAHQTTPRRPTSLLFSFSFSPRR